MGETVRVESDAKWVAVKTRGLDRRDPDGKGWLWGRGTSPRWGGRSRNWCGRWWNWYQLDLVGLTSMHSRDAGSILLDRGWTFLWLTRE